VTFRLDQRFRVGPQLHSRRFDGETIVLHLVRGEYFALNRVGGVIWERLGEGASLREVVDSVLAAYAVDAATAEADVQKLVADLVSAGLLEQAGVSPVPTIE
jgi:hypothetical protein